MKIDLMQNATVVLTERGREIWEQAWAHLGSGHRGLVSPTGSLTYTLNTIFEIFGPHIRPGMLSPFDGQALEAVPCDTPRGGIGIDAPAHVLDYPIEFLGLGSRPLRLLKGANVHRVRDLVCMTLGDLGRIAGLGPRSRYEILHALGGFGLSLRKPSPPPQPVELLAESKRRALDLHVRALFGGLTMAALLEVGCRHLGDLILRQRHLTRPPFTADMNGRMTRVLNEHGLDWGADIRGWVPPSRGARLPTRGLPQDFLAGLRRIGGEDLPRVPEGSTLNEVLVDMLVALVPLLKNCEEWAGVYVRLVRMRGPAGARDVFREYLYRCHRTGMLRDSFPLIAEADAGTWPEGRTERVLGGLQRGLRGEEDGNLQRFYE